MSVVWLIFAVVQFFIFCSCRFPKDPVRRQQWIAAVRRQNFVPSATAVLCTRHFRDEDVDRTSLATVRIREDAVPCIFPAFPAYLQKVRHLIICLGNLCLLYTVAFGTVPLNFLQKQCKR